MDFLVLLSGIVVGLHPVAAGTLAYIRHTVVWRRHQTFEIATDMEQRHDCCIGRLTVCLYTWFMVGDVQGQGIGRPRWFRRAPSQQRSYDVLVSDADAVA
jgi:hypothetical protein